MLHSTKLLTQCGRVATAMARQISSTPMMANNGYEEAILALNSLQTNAATLQKVKKERMKNVHMNLALTTKYLERSGMTVDDLDTLKVKSTNSHNVWV